MDYFRLFNIPKKFKIDKKLLTKNYYQLQLQYHPDLFINDSNFKKKIVLEKSIQINKGYKILKDFLNRAKYFLVLQGFKMKKETILLKNKEFLIKYFSLYEELDDLKKNNFNKIELNYFFLKIEKKIQKYEKEIEAAFEDKNFEKAIKIIEKLLFFRKFKINFKKEQKIYLKKTN